MELITHKKILSRISTDDSLCYIMFDNPIELDRIIGKVLEIMSLKCIHRNYTYKHKFKLIGDYGVDRKFYVYRIYITCDNLAELTLEVMGKQSSIPCFVQLKSNPRNSAYCVEQFIWPTCSCFASHTRISNHNSTVEAWKTLKNFSSTLKGFDIRMVKYDHMRIM